MWYSARLLFEAVVEDGAAVDSLFEESVIIVEAVSEQDAEQKAAEFGREGEHSYANPDGHEVRWRFVELLEIYDTSEDHLFSGTEVYSRLSRKRPC